MIARLVVVGLVVVAVLVADRLYRQWRAASGRPGGPLSQVPRTLLDGAPRTWVVFTTPYCASCGPLTELLRRSDTDARVVTIDATAEPSLARDLAVRAAPTTLLADAEGVVRARFVGTEPVRAHLDQAARAAEPHEPAVLLPQQ
ncbi:MAG: thioredoxin family protein [Acidimicrobiales bacterium]